MSEEVKQEGNFKIKKKPGRPKKLTNKNETVKVDLSKKEEENAKEEEPIKVVINEDAKGDAEPEGIIENA